MPRLASRNATETKPPVTSAGTVCEVQSLPPSIVCTMNGLSGVEPTAHPLRSSANVMSFAPPKSAGPAVTSVPNVPRSVHVAPPSGDRKTRPGPRLAPASQRLAPAHAAPVQPAIDVVSETPELRVHVAPPSAVTNTELSKAMPIGDESRRLPAATPTRFVER